MNTGHFQFQSEVHGNTTHSRGEITFDKERKQWCASIVIQSAPEIRFDAWSDHSTAAALLALSMRTGRPLHEAQRTDQQIIDQTNALARTLYALHGYTVPEGYRFDQSTHPHEQQAWQGARAAQLLLTATDPQDALDNLDED